MAVQPRTRKRVHAIRRAPDGSAFEKCNCCGVLVPIVLNDMHECEIKMEMKRFKGVGGKPNVVKQSYGDQIRSPFRFFMESFVKTCNGEKLIVCDRKGFERWKMMSDKERQPHVIRANMVNAAHERALVKEVDDMLKVDDEADSGMVHKFQKSAEDHEDCELSDCFESLDTYERVFMCSWIIANSWSWSS